MNLTQPPIVLLGDLSNPTDSEGAPADQDTIVPTKPARFAIFAQADKGYVLRDYAAGRDYPFHSKPAAIAGMEMRVDNTMDFLGSPIHIDAYGPAVENIEVFA